MKFYYLTLIFFLSLCDDIIKAQNRYDSPAEAPIINTYVPMSHEEIMCIAMATAWKDRQAQESFEKHSQTAYYYLQKKRIHFFYKLCKCSLRYWILQHAIVLQLRNIVLVVRTATQRKKVFKESF